MRAQLLTAMLLLTAVLAVAAPASAHHDVVSTDSCLTVDPLCVEATATVGDGATERGTCPAGVDTLWEALTHEKRFYCI